MNSQAYNSTPPYESAYAYSGRSAEDQTQRMPAAIKTTRQEAKTYFGLVSFPWPQAVFILVSAFTLAMVLAFPIWNCLLILKSAPMVYFIGKEFPAGLLIGLILCWAFFVVLILIFFDSKSKQVKTWQSLTMIHTAVFTLIGVILMFFGRASYNRVLSVGTEIAENCAMSSLGKPLVSASDQLYRLRYQDSCADKFSVEECEGFKRTHESEVLEAIESDFRCSTWCNNPKAPAAKTPAGKSYPRTLFSTSSFKGSCQMAMIRTMENQLQDLTVQAYAMGIGFAIVAVIMGVAKLLGFCTPGFVDKPAEPKQDAPLTQSVLEARDYGAVERYVRDGVVY